MGELIASLERLERGVLRPTAEQLNASVNEAGQLEVETVVHAAATAAASEIPFLLHPGFAIQEIALDGNAIPHAQSGAILRIARLPQHVAAGTEVKIRARYRGNYTLGCRTTEAGRRWYEFNVNTLWRPLFSLDMRDGARFRVNAELPVRLQVVSAQATTASCIGTAGTTSCLWDTSPACSVDFAFVAGEGEFANRRAGEMTLAALTPHGICPERVLAVAEEILSLYASLWGPCPFPHLAVACPPGSATGNCAREGLVIAGRIGADGLDWAFPVLSHEIAHLWWGLGIRLDVTRPGCGEGLAGYASLVAERHIFGEDALCRSLVESYLPRAKAAEAYGTALFDCTLTMPYSEDLRERKGGCVFLLLEHTIGEEAMASGLRRFAEKFRGTSATPADLRACLAEVAGPEVHAFFDAYMTGTVPIPVSVDRYVS